MSKKIRLKVPATSANLGAGFDTMGIALDLYCYATFKATDGGLRISGCPAEFRGEDNLAARAFRAVEDVIGAGHRGVEIEIDSDIPVARGLGSSAVMLAAGAFAANEIYARPLDSAKLLEITTAIEGHPDNLAPAIYRGSLRLRGGKWQNPGFRSLSGFGKPALCGAGAGFSRFHGSGPKGAAGGSVLQRRGIQPEPGCRCCPRPWRPVTAPSSARRWTTGCTSPAGRS